MKESVFFKSALGFLLIYSVYSVFVFFFQAHSNFESYKDRRTKQLVGHMRIALGKGVSPTQVAGLLKSSSEDRYIDFFILWPKDQGLPISQGLTTDIDPSFLRSLPDGQFREYQKIQVAKASLGDGSQLAIGNFISSDYYIRYLLRENHGRLLADATFVLLTMLAVVLYHFRDVFKLFYYLRGNRKMVGQMRSSSKELKVITETIKGYEITLEENQGKLQSLESQLLPAYRDLKPSTLSFDAVIVRTDINHFSTQFNSGKREDLQALVKVFFVEATKIISRHGGKVIEYLGDEIVYYFGANTAESKPSWAAISAVREVCALGELLHGQNYAQKGICFTLKSALSMGELKYSEVGGRFSLEGAPFIESVRILSEIENRDTNSVVFPKTMSKDLELFCEFKKFKTVQLKGQDFQTEILALHKFLNLEDQLASVQIKALEHFRTQGELVRIIDWVSTNLSTLSEDNLQKVFSHMRWGIPDEKQTVLGEKMVALLGKMKELPYSSRTLSAYLQLFRHRLLAQDCSERFAPILESLLKHSDRRIVADAVEVIAHFSPHISVPLSDSYLFHLDNRISANVIVKMGKELLSKEVLRTLRQRLNSSNVNYQASAIYAAGELASIYLKKDPVLLRSHLEFMEIFGEIPSFARSESSMVVRQALLAVKKCADARLEKKLYEVFLSLPMNSSAHALFQYIWGWEAAIKKAG